MVKRPDTNAQRLKRHKRVRAKISGTPERPRLNVFRSKQNIYAQIIDDVNGVTLVSASSLEKDFEGYRDEFKWQLVKSAIVKDYDVKVEAEDMKREGRQIAAAQLQQYGLYGLTDEQLDGFAAKLLEDEKQRQHLYERALDNKVFDVIRENVKLEEQEISMADFEKLFQK